MNRGFFVDIVIGLRRYRPDCPCVVPISLGYQTCMPA
jgi:hypothetical protein